MTINGFLSLLASRAVAFKRHATAADESAAQAF